MARARAEDAERWKRRVARIISAEEAVGFDALETTPLRWFDDRAAIIFSNFSLGAPARRARRKQRQPISETTRARAHDIVARVIAVLFGDVYAYAVLKMAEAAADNRSERAHRRPIAHQTAYVRVWAFGDVGAAVRAPSPRRLAGDGETPVGVAHVVRHLRPEDQSPSAKKRVIAA